MRSGRELRAKTGYHLVYLNKIMFSRPILTTNGLTTKIMKDGLELKNVHQSFYVICMKGLNTKNLVENLFCKKLSFFSSFET